MACYIILKCLSGILVYINRRQHSRLRLAYESVKWVDPVRHLRIIFIKNRKENSEITHKRVILFEESTM